MNCIGIIPARFGSTRFPGKPLAEIAGKSMIQRVYEQASKSKHLKKVLVATDDDRILKHVSSFGGAAMMTSENHVNGTQRCEEVVSNLNESYDVVINIQGDEPLIQPKLIDSVCEIFEIPDIEIATLITKIDSSEDLLNPNVVKVVTDKNGSALYFSRSPIPYNKNIQADKLPDDVSYLQHIGLYAYRTDVLQKLVKLEPSKLEMAESLEQLRWLENGFSLQTIFSSLPSYAVDSPSDIGKIEKLLETQ
ncbi:MAG: 3-deoxy-manno-octulosonate cytidylyltransferase [Bacteroidia bacterium]|nr:3-deoxy-manno-octulosonate cytidylyltransferase [Bacteroidia bacterium]